MEEKKVEIILTRGYDKKTVSLEEAIADAKKQIEELLGEKDA